jgi:hypothetical protein
MPALSPLTLRREQNLYEKIERYFGDALLREADTALIKRTYSHIRSKGGETQSSLQKLHKTLQQVFKQAVNEQIIPRNPCDAIQMKTLLPLAATVLCRARLWVLDKRDQIHRQRWQGAHQRLWPRGLQLP